MILAIFYCDDADHSPCFRTCQHVRYLRTW
jgi:hypothetical protein